MTRWLATVIALAACGSGGREPAGGSGPVAAIDAAIGRGGAYLAAQQRADGAIPSRAYAALKDGWSLTPLAALALRMAALDRPELAGAYRRAVDYVATMVAPDGVLRAAPEVSYPLYAYALGALVLGAPDNRRHGAAHAKLLDGLRALQLGSRNGWRPGDASFGGWGYAAVRPVRPAGAAGDEPASNLSATVLAIGALALGGAAGDPALVEARGFVERCQNLDGDGGFFFSPAIADANKAGADGGRYRSYGSMTADGVRALLRLGVAPPEPRAAAAVAWLERSFDAARNPGAFPEVAEVRRASSYYYWVWSAAHVARHLQRRAWADALAAELVRLQGEDGSWRNPASEMREDDPIVATSFALAGLALARSVIASAPRSHAN